MSGRVRTTLPNGRRVTGFRKTLRTIPNRRLPNEMADWRLVIDLPDEIAFAVSHIDQTGVIGVVMQAPGIILVTGKDHEWVIRQAATFLGRITAGSGEVTVIGVLEREGDNGRPIVIPCDFSVTTEPSVVVNRPHREPVIVRIGPECRGG